MCRVPDFTRDDAKVPGVRDALHHGLEAQVTQRQMRAARKVNSVGDQGIVLRVGQARDRYVMRARPEPVCVCDVEKFRQQGGTGKADSRACR